MCVCVCVYVAMRSAREILDRQVVCVDKSRATETKNEAEQCVQG